MSAAGKLASERFEFTVLDTLERLSEEVRQLRAERSNVVPMWVDKKGLAQHLGVSISYVEKLMQKGAPHRFVGAKAQFSPQKVETWMVSKGYLREIGAR